MGVINLEDIEPGMTLECNIVNRNGLVLLRGEEEITQKHLRILRMWGITEAAIKGVGREEVMDKFAAKIDPRLLEEATTKAYEIFRHNDRKHPFIKELLRLATLRFARHLR